MTPLFYIFKYKFENYLVENSVLMDPNRLSTNLKQRMISGVLRIIIDVSGELSIGERLLILSILSL